MARWVAALAGIAAAGLGLATWLSWWAADLYHQMDVFYRTSGTEQHPDEVYRYYDTISRNSFVMQGTLTPLLAGSMVAVLALLVMLAVRWERSNP